MTETEKKDTEEFKEGLKAPETEDEGEKPFDEYTLEEIYQYCKKRQAEDAGPGLPMRPG